MTSSPPVDFDALYAEIEALPDHQVGEILEGELVVSPRPAIPHARASSKLGGRLSTLFDGPGSGGGGGAPGGWWIVDEPELHLATDCVVPDIAGWRRERMPALPDVAFITLPPDWVCEVLSPASARHDRVAKRRIYAREGVAHYWLVDPLHRTLEVWRLTGGEWVVAATHGGDERVRAEPFDAVELDLAEWWIPDPE